MLSRCLLGMQDGCVLTGPVGSRDSSKISINTEARLKAGFTLKSTENQLWAWMSAAIDSFSGRIKGQSLPLTAKIVTGVWLKKTDPELSTWPGLAANQDSCKRNLTAGWNSTNFLHVNTNPLNLGPCEVAVNLSSRQGGFKRCWCCAKWSRRRMIK